MRLRNNPFMQYLVAVCAMLGLVFGSCAAFKDIQRTLANLARVQFKLGTVTDFTLAGIPLAGKTGVSANDGALLLSAYLHDELPASFTLTVEAVNPNDGTGGTPQASATMTSFDWTLVIDTTFTIRGDLAEPLTIPGTGQTVTIPLRMNLDLLRFFRHKEYQSLINLALAMGGHQGSASRLQLRARPTIQTNLGPIKYPDYITIVDKEFRAEADGNAFVSH